MADYPAKLQEYIDDFGFVTTRDERAEFLISIADEFEPVPESIATKPYEIQAIPPKMPFVRRPFAPERRIR